VPGGRSRGEARRDLRRLPPRPRRRDARGQTGRRGTSLGRARRSVAAGPSRAAGRGGRVDREEGASAEGETERFGLRLAARLGPDDVVYLVGPLGAGKTALARGLARGLKALPREVASPTFAILHEYAEESGRVVLRHLDLYRLKDEERDLAILG